MLFPSEEKPISLAPNSSLAPAPSFSRPPQSLAFCRIPVSEWLSLLFDKAQKSGASVHYGLGNFVHSYLPGFSPQLSLIYFVKNDSDY